MALKGTEQLWVVPVQSNGQITANQQQCSTADIAALAATEGAPFVVTPITTVGNGTLTAAGLVGGEILRSGPVAAFSDATDTAAAIIAALPAYVLNESFNILIKNTTAFTQTITAGTGVTLPATVIVPAFSVVNYVASVTSPTTVTFVHIDTTPISVGTNSTAPSITSLSTVGAGTILAAGFVSSVVARSGAQSATPFTDTTDTAANIIAACANLVNKIGTSFVFTYQNTTNAAATITGGTGVTVSGITVVPANSFAQYIVTYTAAATLTMVGYEQGYIPNSGTFTANQGTAVVVSNTAVSPSSQIIFTLKTIGGTPAGAPFLSAITAGTGFSVKAFTGDTSVYNYQILG